MVDAATKQRRGTAPTAWEHFRHRLVLSTLTGKDLRLASPPHAPLRPHHLTFLRLLEKIVNGATVEIDPTATSLTYRPGVLVGGDRLVHDCGAAADRDLGYYIEPLLVLALFAKKGLSITLRGVTNGAADVGVDTLRTVSLPLLRLFGVHEGAQLRVLKRGAPPRGGGEVALTLPALRQLTPLSATDPGRVKRVRGIAYATKVAPQMVNRLVESSRGVLNQFLPDVWIYTDVHKGASSGASPGFAVTLVAESTNGSLLSAEVAAVGGAQPEEVGLAASAALLEQIRDGGTVDATHQPLMLLLMALCPEDVSRVRTGPLTPHTERLLRLIRDYLGVTFQIKQDLEDSSVLLSCRGSNLRNIALRTS